MSERAKLIFLEGISGAGKDSYDTWLTNYFTSLELNPLFFTEPTEFLRPTIDEYRRRPRTERFSEVEAMLYTADRKQQYNLLIDPALQDPKNVVVMKRSYVSTAVYNASEEKGLLKVLNDNSFFPKPDLTLTFLCDPKTALSRISGRPKEISPDEHYDKISQLRERYLTLSKILTRENFALLNTDGSKAAVEHQIKSHLNHLLDIPMQKALFLDKDGTLVDSSAYPAKIPTDEVMMDKTLAGLKQAQNKDYKLIIISSQPWAVRGKLTEQQIENAFKSVTWKYLQRGVKIDGYYYCLHQRVEEGGQVDCDCKKPKTGLLEQAATKFNISTLGSYFVGDSQEDIITGRNFGLESVLVKTGLVKDTADLKVQPSIVAEDVNAFAKILK
jgi:D-glycero-D-manno-heptose 1,7-bisphosphate phosphatase